MRSVVNDIKIYDASALPESTITAVAATDVITSGDAHGLSVDDKLQFTTTDTLPAGLSTSTNYYVISVPSTTTFKVSATLGGSSVDITDTGTGTHSYHLKGKMIYVGDYSHVDFAINFTTTPTMTVKFQGTSQRDSIDLSLAQSATNRWDYIDSVDNEDGASIDGDDGISVAGSNDNRIVELNTNGKQWVSADVTAYTAGKVSIMATAYES